MVSPCSCGRASHAGSGQLVYRLRKSVRQNSKGYKGAVTRESGAVLATGSMTTAPTGADAGAAKTAAFDERQSTGRVEMGVPSLPVLSARTR